jgi:hypothetical protein
MVAATPANQPSPDSSAAMLAASSDPDPIDPLLRRDRQPKQRRPEQERRCREVHEPR